MNQPPELLENQKAVQKLAGILQEHFGEDVNLFNWTMLGKEGSRTTISPIEVADNDQSIILVDIDCFRYFYDLVINPFYINCRPDLIERRKYLEGYKFENISPSESGIEECMEVTTPDGAIIHIMPKAEYPVIRNTGIQKRSAKIRGALVTYFRDPENERPIEHEAANALTGDYEFIVPVLDGLKPATVIEINEGIQNLLNQLQSEIPDFKAVPYNYDEFPDIDRERIIFNSNAVEKVVKDNPDIFEAIGINSSMQAEEIIKLTLGLNNSLNTNQHKKEITNAVGLLLGFDKKSVLDFTPLPEPGAEAFCKHNIWGVSYKIKQGPEVAQLKSDYDLLLKTIEELLTEGLGPMEVLRTISRRGKQKLIQEEARAEIARNIPI